MPWHAGCTTFCYWVLVQSMVRHSSRRVSSTTHRSCISSDAPSVHCLARLQSQRAPCSPIAYRLAGRRAAVMAAWLLAVTFLHVRDSHFLTVDIPATFWGCLSMALLMGPAHSPRSGPPWAGAVILGLAMATKYNLALFLPALVYVGFSRHPNSARAGSREVAILLLVGALLGESQTHS